MAKHNDEMLEDGYTIFRDRLNKSVLYDLVYHKAIWDRPTRGHDVFGKYYSSYEENVPWANYWTDPVSDNSRIADIRKVVDTLVSEFMDYPVFYHSDCSVVTPLCNKIRPHVDTPHRHTPWNTDSRLLGIQVAIPINEFSPAGRSGTTALVPGSHKRHWDIARCYKGEYTTQFLSEAVQPELHYGDILMLDAKTLHSHMPNITDFDRYMLVMNYLDERIVKDVMDYEASLLS